jgi:hypothetical protein
MQHRKNRIETTGSGLRLDRQGFLHHNLSKIWIGYRFLSQGGHPILSEILIIICAYAVYTVISAFPLRYVCTFWGRSLKEDPEFVMPFLPCLVVGPFVMPFSIPIAALTWLFSFINNPGRR